MSTDESELRVSRLDLAELLDYAGYDIEHGIDVPPAVVEAHQRMSDELSE